MVRRYRLFMVILLAGVAVANVAHAASIVIDFESLAINDAASHSLGSTPYTEDRFTLNAVGFPDAHLQYLGTQADNFAGSTALSVGTIDAFMQLTSDAGETFDAVSIDFATLTGSSLPVTFTGYFAAGGTIELQVQVPSDLPPRTYDLPVTGLRRSGAIGMGWSVEWSVWRWSQDRRDTASVR